MKHKRVVFVINPNSGSNRKVNRVELVGQLLPSSFDSTIIEWKQVSDAEAIFARVTSEGYDIAVAVGGDGTVSQLAHALCGTGIALGILPFGSGNGLARHLGIPMNTAAAMQLLEHGNITTIDRGHANGHSFFCTAGSGFDARIGKLFAESTTRGFWTYARITLRELRNYTPERCSIVVDGKAVEHDAFLITVANAGQYGNNAWIAPQARVNDGILHLAVLKPFRIWQVPGLVWRMFGKSIDRSALVATYSGKHITIIRPTDGPAHFDGEPAQFPAILTAGIDAGVLNVMVPKNFKG